MARTRPYSMSAGPAVTLLDLLYVLSAIVLLPWWLVLLIMRPEFRAGFVQRFGFVRQPPVGAQAIWLHGASAGEVDLLKPLVRKIEASHPGVPIVVSAFAISGYLAARKAFGHHTVVYGPIDLTPVIRRFTRWCRPRLVVLVESEFWPNLIAHLDRNDVPVCVVNGKISERSFRLHRRTFFVARALRRVNVFAVQAEEHAARLRQLGVAADRIHVAGNMKYDLTDAGDVASRRRELRERYGIGDNEVVLLGGSVHSGEYEALAAAFARLLDNGYDLRLILVPRYVAEAQTVVKALAQEGLTGVLKTALHERGGDPALKDQRGVLIVDTMGELKDHYALSDIAYVGGSLHFRSSNKGGHNLMEPAILGVVPLFGPYNYSFRETVDALQSVDAGYQVRDVGEMVSTLRPLLDDPASTKARGRSARQVILDRRGATAMVFGLLDGYLGESRTEEHAVPVESRTRERSAVAGLRSVLYSTAMYLLMPWAICHLLWRGLRYPAYLRRWEQRFGFVPRLHEHSIIWVHAVSVGEVRAVIPLVEFLLERYPDHEVLMSTMTPTGSEQVEQILGNRVRHCYVPYDLPDAVRRFLDRVRPRMALIVETEFWPNIFRLCARAEVPLLLVNVRVSPRSFRGYRRFPGFTRSMLEHVARMAVQSEQDAERLSELGAPDRIMRVTGNLKFDVQVPAGVREDARRLRQDWGTGRPVFIAGSTHEGEESILLSALEDIRKSHPDVLLVIVPRHPERFVHVERLCQNAGLRVARRSDSRGQPLPAEAQVVVGNTMGELPLLYAASDLAFVGGSLIPHGGQNLIEALAVGVPVIFGPHMFNFEQSSAVALKTGAAIKIGGPAELAPAVLAFLDDETFRAKAAAAAHAVVAGNQGSLQATIDWIGQAATQDSDVGQPVAAQPMQRSRPESDYPPLTEAPEADRRTSRAP